ncbi:hypothetical protein J6590_016697 [Homalodisca vitripennis]|nr:hypothetical protein J6590_016697 [Homalodisca vitripennis]
MVKHRNGDGKLRALTSHDIIFPGFPKEHEVGPVLKANQQQVRLPEILQQHGHDEPRHLTLSMSMVEVTLPIIHLTGEDY